MYPPTIARHSPDRLAYVMAADSHGLTYADLDRRSNQFAHLLVDHGVRAGDALMLVAENRLEWPVVVAAAMRSGLEVTPANWHLTATELEALVAESAPRVVVTTTLLRPTVEEALTRAGLSAATVVIDLDPAWSWTADLPTSPLAHELLGARVLFSGGSTGRPKAYRQPLLGIHPLDAPARHPHLGQALGLDADTVFLSPAPNYHAAPFTFQLMVQSLGGTVVCLERFDPAAAVEAIATHGVTHSQWVPTMLSRMVRLADHRPLAPTHRVAITSGAPCPIDLKEEITRWWGPVLHEYYGASEGYGHTYASPTDAAERPGTVGRPLGSARVRVVDERGRQVDLGTVGRVQFLVAGGDALDPDAWKGMGDLGRLDEDGYLYLAGRATFMIVSGGVNIHPEEVEEVLLGHPAVADVAVIGLPDPDLGERVHAVVECEPGSAPGPDDLRAWCRARLAGFKVPRTFDFVDHLPRRPTGKLNKQALRDSYVGATS